MLEGASYANRLESCTLNAIHILHTLVTHSSHVRAALVKEHSGSDTSLAKTAATAIEAAAESTSAEKVRFKSCLFRM